MNPAPGCGACEHLDLDGDALIAPSFCDGSGACSAPDVRPPWAISANGICTTRWHDLRRLDDDWWARCSNPRRAHGLEYRECVDCPPTRPSTITRRVDE